MKVHDTKGFYRDYLIAIASRAGLRASVLGMMSVGILLLTPIAAQAQKSPTMATVMEAGKPANTLSPLQQDCAKLDASNKECVKKECGQLEAVALAAAATFRTCINTVRGNTTGPGEYTKQERDACITEYNALSAAYSPYVQCANNCYEKTYGSYDSILWAEEVQMVCLTGRPN